MPVLPAPLVLALLASASPQLQTTAERSGWKRTGRYDEVVALCAAFSKAYRGKVRCEAFGTTPEGRPMLALVVSGDGTLDPQAARSKKRPVVLFQGGIHAGEIDGKDAGFWFLRDALDGRLARDALDKVTLVFVPVFNVDGHERVSPLGRPNQNGPEGAGWRVTSQNLNLNRDYTKAEAPEMAAMLRLLGAWDPLFYVDLHVTDGARFRHGMAVIVEPHHTGPETLRRIGAAISDASMKELTASGHMPVPFYPAFLKDDDPGTGFDVTIGPPRISTSYWALRNRFGVLVETHSWNDYATRVRATRDALVSIVSQAAQHGTEWMRACAAADEADHRRGGTEVALDWESDGKSRPTEFQGYAYTRETSNLLGRTVVKYDLARPEIWKAPLFHGLKPLATAVAPKAGYLVPPGHASWMREKLALHGFASTVLTRTHAAVTMEAFRATETKFRPDPYEGRQTVAVKGMWAKTTRDVPARSLFVPIAQRGNALLVHLFDPAGPDSLLAWGFFNSAFEVKEYIEDYVLEPWARKRLEEDRAVNAEFEAKLSSDQEFARNAEARARFFHQRHPSWDERVDLYPVFKVDRPLE